MNKTLSDIKNAQLSKAFSADPKGMSSTENRAIRRARAKVIRTGKAPAHMFVFKSASYE